MDFDGGRPLGGGVRRNRECDANERCGDKARPLRSLYTHAFT